ncbi:FecR family protein [Pedobacter cryoconitis]|uniref:Ferric-dicitrate binding protein FerR (Iron transport regulator) n=1 Tax=Pedobacter cryoconitis TaxID=188932 RepID=A0A7X0J3A5_9SPHI|nr:FecR domain-containing protein [Pedobacter cryoconitis]MBB6499002.1 ferric-dicitrate binding protein FerR (iron transport regulator) [Pedobacter cryoconitis]
MLKDQFHISKLITRFLRGTINTEEQAELDNWIAASADNRKFMEGFSEELLAADLQVFRSVNEDAIWAKVQQRLESAKAPKKTEFKVLQRIYYRVAVAATIALMCGIWFYTSRHLEGSATTKNFLTNDIAPGKTGATLTLSNGKTIVLGGEKDGKLAEEPGISISKTKDGQLEYTISGTAGSTEGKMNTLSTAVGQTYILNLPDHSRVYLNAASSLTYPSSFSGSKIRRVELLGEGYFEIAEDKAHPFVVVSLGQQVEVLGTHFNINAYQNEPALKTTLMEGSVRVSNTSGKQFLVLKPGQQSILTEDGIQVTKVDTDLAIAWKNNEFMFENESIENIMRMVERWYNVEVVYIGARPTERFVGVVSRFDNVSKVLQLLESTGGVNFKIEGRKIYVSK